MPNAWCLMPNRDMEVAVSPSALGDAAVHLPWLSPCAASLVALTGAPAAARWSEVRADPGAVLLLLRQGDTASAPVTAQLRSPALLTTAADFLEQPDAAGF